MTNKPYKVYTRIQCGNLNKGDAMSQPNPSLVISIPQGTKAELDLFSGPLGEEHFGEAPGLLKGRIFGIDRWAAVEQVEGGGLELVYPWIGEEKQSRSEILGGADRQAICYIGGVDPEGMAIDFRHTPGSFTFEAGLFARPIFNGPEGVVVRKIEYTHRHEINSGFFGRMLVYSALKPVESRVRSRG
jgi:hypothetical protein